MPIALDLITRKKLFLGKLLYQQAVVQSTSSYSDVSRILAVIAFDLATESVLKVVVATLEPAKTPADSFQGLIQQADKLLNDNKLSPVPDKANIQHVHSLRNDAQHKAKYPSRADVEDSRTYVRDFLHKLLLNVWGLSLDSMSLTDVIQHAEIKNHLVAAETALSNDEFNEAVIKAEVAFSTALSSIKSSIVGRMEQHANPTLTYVPWDKSHPSTYSLLETMRDHIVRASVGLSFSDFRQYKDIVDSVIVSLAFFGGGKYRVAVTGKKVSKKDAELVVAYVINSVIQIESVAGNLETPFNSEHSTEKQMGRRIKLRGMQRESR